MAKAKKDDNKLTIHFRGGPRDGQTMVVDKNRVPERMRLALPEWANYYRVDDTDVFEYRDIPWVPLPFSWK